MRAEFGEFRFPAGRLDLPLPARQAESSGIAVLSWGALVLRNYGTIV
jgi:hypothetical protein